MNWSKPSAGLIPWLLGLEGIWLGLHAYVLVAYLTGLGSAPWRFGVPADPLAAGAALALLAGLATVGLGGGRTNRTGFTWRRWRWG